MIVPDQPIALPEGTRVIIDVSIAPSPSEFPRRQGGWWKGRVFIAADFDELPEDIARSFGMDRA